MTSASLPYCGFCCTRAGRAFGRKSHPPLKKLLLIDFVNSTESLLNRLIMQAISRGAVTRCFMSSNESDVKLLTLLVFLVLNFSLVAVVYLIVVRCSRSPLIFSLIFDPRGPFLVPHHA